MHNFTHDKSLPWNHYDSFWCDIWRFVWCFPMNLSLIFFSMISVDDLRVTNCEMMLQTPAVSDCLKDTWNIVSLSPLTFIRNVIVCLCWRLGNPSQLCDFAQSIAVLSIEVNPFYIGKMLQIVCGMDLKVSMKAKSFRGVENRRFRSAFPGNSNEKFTKM